MATLKYALHTYNGNVAPLDPDAVADALPGPDNSKRFDGRVDAGGGVAGMGNSHPQLAIGHRKRHAAVYNYSSLGAGCPSTP